jgi:dihydroorotase
MKDAILIQGGRVIDPTSGQEAVKDIRISGNSITAIADKLPASDSDSVFDAQGLWVCPGFIDMHTHLRDLGQKDKEDIESGTRAAAAGGFTTVVAMANTDPPVDNGAILSVLLARIEDKAHIDVLAVAAVTRGLAGEELTNMSELADLGAVAFSDDGMTISNMAVLRRALEYARMTGRVVISHAEDRDLSAGGCIQEGHTCTSMGLAGIPAASETAAVARELEIVRLTGAPYHFTHVSCAQTVRLIKRAKEDGLPVTADVTPHHLTLNVDQIAGYDTNYKMKPPLRLASDQEALAQGLKDGTIDAIATDHAPHTRLEKATTMEEASVGIIGLETAFSLCYERLVMSAILTPVQLVSLFTSKPASILSLPAPSLDVGAPANITVIDVAAKWTYDPTHGMSKSHNSPYAGKSMHGKPILTIYGGALVHTDERATASRFKTHAVQ